MSLTKDEQFERFSLWLQARVIDDARGSNVESLDVDPDGRIWLGRLAPEEAVRERGLGDRGERLDPCAAGFSLRLAGPGPWAFDVKARAVAWQRIDRDNWTKSNPVSVTVPVVVEDRLWSDSTFGEGALATALERAVDGPGLTAKVQVTVEPGEHGSRVVTVVLVNTSPKKHPDLKDTNLYETHLEVVGLETSPFVMPGMPDTFRYDRSVSAYGINGGVEFVNGVFRSTDAAVVDKYRPDYWGSPDPAPDLQFVTLARDPVLPIRSLLSSFEAWASREWSAEALDVRSVSEGWTVEMVGHAATARTEFEEEIERLRRGVELLERDDVLRRSFCLMNEAIQHSSRGKYEAWRPFQIGFLLANLACIADPSAQAEVADIVWFATGGGKTETYLGLLLTAIFHDRLTGKASGITAWSRFPLRMLSLQQTQRFADALAGAELVRRREGIDGSPFSLGFFVGAGATPNQIKEEAVPNSDDFDIDDDEAPERYQVLSRCPFCGGSIEMAFDRRTWRLEHRCASRNRGCPWPERSIPFFIVDDEIYRFLPTVVVGTLDKAALISMQASIRGFVGAPMGMCSKSGHGYSYAVRSSKKAGCLVPGCKGRRAALDMPVDRYAPSFRLQDELHLLRDSLGAVDAHYEALLDGLQAEICGRVPKVLASSATLAGYEKQVDTLYQRRGRVFPQPGPRSGAGFWSTDTSAVARTFVGLAPRGVTTEFATDRMVTVLQQSIRRLLTESEVVCAEAGVDPALKDELVSLYGVNVIYGNTLRDLDTSARSLETQIPVRPLISAQLTGQTDFEDVRKTLDRLDSPEQEFEERIHVITASAMMSHGVDIDRLNIMVMIGLPLGTAELIQASARVGRRWPGVVFVLHKIARERDAAVFRLFPKFIEQADRFVEPIPVTRRSRRVLRRTAPGIAMSRNHAARTTGHGAPHARFSAESVLRRPA